MTLLTFIFIVVLVGVVLYLVNAFIPMEGNIKRFLNIAVVIILVLWFLSLLGVLPSLSIPINVRGN